MTIVGIKDVRTWLGKDLADLFDFSVEGNYIIIKAKNWLRKEDFAKASAVVKQHGGEWMSLGKMSHFRLMAGTPPITQIEKESKRAGDLERVELVRIAIDLLEKALTKLREAGY